MVWADFRQSNSFDNIPKDQPINERVWEFKSNRSEESEIDHFILGKMDGGNTIDQIAGILQEYFPIHFKTQEKAQFYVKALAQQYGRLQALNPEVIN